MKAYLKVCAPFHAPFHISRAGDVLLLTMSSSTCWDHLLEKKSGLLWKLGCLTLKSVIADFSSQAGVFGSVKICAPAIESFKCKSRDSLKNLIIRQTDYFSDS